MEKRNAFCAIEAPQFPIRLFKHLLGVNSLLGVAIITSSLFLVGCANVGSQKEGGLSAASMRFLNQVQQDIHIRAFFPGGADQTTSSLLLLYKDANQRISVEFVDPEKQPDLSDRYDVTVYGESRDPTTGTKARYGTVVLEAGAKRERIEQEQGVNEEDVTNALARLIKGEVKTIYFIEGHGEKQIENADPSGYSIVVGKLKSKNYLVKNVNLMNLSAMPEDASVVILAGPASEPSPMEIEILQTYLQGGGSLLLLLEPAPAPSLNELTMKWSIEAQNDLVIDASGKGKLLGAGRAVPLSTTYGEHRITERYRNVVTFFPFARSVTQMPASEGVTVQPLVTSDTESWGERTFTPPPTFDQITDVKGPLPLALVSTKTLDATRKNRLVVYGDSDFPTNEYGIQQANMNLFIDTVTWLAQDRDFISIHPTN